MQMLTFLLDCDPDLTYCHGLTGLIEFFFCFFFFLLMCLSLSLTIRKAIKCTSLVAQWLRLCTPNAEGPGSIPGQGTSAHMSQQGVHMPQVKIPCAATEAWYSQINKY